MMRHVKLKTPLQRTLRNELEYVWLLVTEIAVTAPLSVHERKMYIVHGYPNNTQNDGNACWG